MFKLSRTFHKPASANTGNVARGFPAPGAGAQTTGDFTPGPLDAVWGSEYPTKGARTWQDPGGSVGDVQTGFPAPTAPGQRRPAGSMPNVPAYGGLPSWSPVMQQSYGAGRMAPQYGKVLTNPIGAGVVALYRPQASYGVAAQYVAGVDFWTSQAIPTSVNLQGLTDPAVLAAVLGPINVKAAVRVG